MYYMSLSSHSAIIEHTNKVLYMEDDDIAVVTKGQLSIHRMNRQAGEDPVRAIQTLQMELQQIMKGEFKYINSVSKNSYIWKSLHAGCGTDQVLFEYSYSCAPPVGWKAQYLYFSVSDACLLISFAGNFDSFMQKEIFEQPETVVNTMRGRICFDSNTGDLHVFSNVKDRERNFRNKLNDYSHKFRNWHLISFISFYTF